MNYDTSKKMQMKVTFISLLCIVGIFFTPLLAQESCYEQYLREHNMKILMAEDADDSYDELKKTVLAKQIYADSYLLMVDSIAQRVMITKVDGSYIADVHVALVDSIWYMWLSVDPLADKNIANTPYMYCNGNPIMLIDPNGRDSISVTYNSKTRKWDIGNIIISQGNDVVSVTGKDGNTSSYEFSEGEYGKRICSVRLASTAQQTLGMFYLSGAGFAGYSVEPPGEPDNARKGVPIETGVYDISKCGGNKWTGWPVLSSSTLSAGGRGVCIHYAGNHDENYELKNQNVSAVSWTQKCMVISNDYILDKSGYVRYNSINSFNTALRIAQYCGASGYTPRTSSNNSSNYYINSSLNF